MVNYNSDSHVTFLPPHSALSWPSWSAFVHLWFSFASLLKLRVATSAFRITPISLNSPFLNQVSHFLSLGHQFFCYTITTTQHCIVYPKFECAKPSKKVFVYLCPNNRVQISIGILIFPTKASLHKIYTSKVLEDWLNCIWQRKLLFIFKSWMALFLNLHQLPLPPGHSHSSGSSSIDNLW